MGTTTGRKANPVVTRRLPNDLLHTPRALSFRAGEFSRRVELASLFDRRVDRNPDIPILIVDTDHICEEGLPEMKKKYEAHNTVDELHDPATKWTVVGKRRYNNDDELIQPDNEREEFLSGMERKPRIRNIIGKMHNPATKWKVVRKRKNDNYDGDDELNQPDIKRPKRSKKQGCFHF
ncbi:hypothetical protein NW761_008220 [Fusarium oxysporum]|nr:hypothetical protein NW758_006778 [Fusarium oxysporum]KAJ4086600.1 hypothetical protein NW761_008220 [Fusarium oxysporum]